MDYDATNTAAAYDRGCNLAPFTSAAEGTLVQEVAPTCAVFADKIAAGADSVLASLSRDGFEAGLGALRFAAARSGEKPVTEPID